MIPLYIVAYKFLAYYLAISMSDFTCRTIWKFIICNAF